MFQYFHINHFSKDFCHVYCKISLFPQQPKSAKNSKTNVIFFKWIYLPSFECVICLLNTFLLLLNDFKWRGCNKWYEREHITMVLMRETAIKEKLAGTKRATIRGKSLVVTMSSNPGEVTLVLAYFGPIPVVQLTRAKNTPVQSRIKQITSQQKRWPFLLWCPAVPPNCASQGHHSWNGPDSAKSYRAICLFGPWGWRPHDSNLGGDKALTPVRCPPVTIWASLDGTKRATPWDKSLVATQVRIMGRPLWSWLISVQSRWYDWPEPKILRSNPG